jgi:DNA repair protein RadC
MNIGPTIPKNQIEELMNVQGIGEQSFLKLKALVVIAPAKTAER